MDDHRAGDAMQTPKESEEVSREPPRENLAKCESGAIYVEFLIAFFPVFIMVLGIIQISLMYTAHVVVQHSASTAVRAAIVVIPDDPARYNGAAIGQLADGRSGGGNPLEAFLALLGGAANVRVNLPSIPGLGGLGGGGGGGSDASSPRSVYANTNGRMSAIHAAANIPLASISPSIDQLLERETSVRDALGRNEPVIRAATALVYNQAAMAVTFPTSPNATTYGNAFYDNMPVTVRVTYMFHCAVPIARMFICKDPITLRFGEGGAAEAFGRAIRRGDVGGIVGGYVGVMAAESAEIARNPGLGELTVAPLYSLILATSGTGQRYVVLRGEATLPLQGAQYQYRQSPRGGAGGGF